jgi:hypothetical protein
MLNPETKKQESDDQPRRILFQVFQGVSGNKYTIYDNGDIEGFGDGAIISNYYPQLLAIEIQAKGMPSAPSCDTSIRTADRAGAGHSSPR